MAQTTIFIVLLLFNAAITFASYVPPYYEGDPITMGVTALDPPDFTGKPVYRIEFVLEAENGHGTPYTEGFVHRFVRYVLIINNILCILFVNTYL